MTLQKTINMKRKKIGINLKKVRKMMMNICVVDVEMFWNAKPRQPKMMK